MSEEFALLLLLLLPPMLLLSSMEISKLIEAASEESVRPTEGGSRGVMELIPRFLAIVASIASVFLARLIWSFWQRAAIWNMASACFLSTSEFSAGLRGEGLIAEEEEEEEEEEEVKEEEEEEEDELIESFFDRTAPLAEIFVTFEDEDMPLGVKEKIDFTGPLALRGEC